MAAEASQYQGSIEGLIGEQLFGWCREIGDDRPVPLEIHVNNRLLAKVAASDHRGDLEQSGIGRGYHGFMSPPLTGIAPNAVISVRVAGTDIELTHSGRALSAYGQLPAPPRTTSGLQIVPRSTDFIAARAAVFPGAGNTATFRALGFANLVVEPGGTMRMPPYRIANRATDDYRIAQCPANLPEGKFPAALPFPEMVITTLENAYCLPFATPFLPRQRKVITEFLIPWAPEATPWFERVAEDVYRPTVDIDLEDTEYDIDVGFYMDHSVSEHYGHFLGDCLCRMYGWDIARQIFGNEVKLIIASKRTPDNFQLGLLAAAGASSDDIIRISRLVRCKRLLLATQSLGVEYYASPTSARLWTAIRDRTARRDLSLPDRVYLSRSLAPIRPLMNEPEVERIFARFGFTIVRPELLSAEQQNALIANALLVAGPGGSGMYNLAFQGRLRSAFILVREDRLQLTEMLVSAGRSCDLWYHLGRRENPGLPWDATAWFVDPARLASDVADWVAASMS